jgi:MOSC domain-containing protein YiiM
MRDFDAFERAWIDSPAPPRRSGPVHLIVLRKGGGVHETVDAVQITTQDGLVGDKWADGKRKLAAQVTLMSHRAAQIVTEGHAPLHSPGDNLLVDLDLSLENLPTGTRLRAGTALLEVTDDPHAGCHLFRARMGDDALRWINWHLWRDRRLRGIKCRVLEDGEVRVGQTVEVEA